MTKLNNSELAGELVKLTHPIISNFYIEKNISFSDAIPSQFIYIAAMIMSTAATIAEFSGDPELYRITMNSFLEELNERSSHHENNLAALAEHKRKTNAH